MESHEEVMEYRMTAIEKQYEELRSDLKEVKEVVNRLDKRFAGVPDGVALNCQLHNQLMQEMRKEIDNHQVLIDGLLAFKWRAVGIVSVVMLIMQIVGGSIAEKIIKHDTAVQPVRIEFTTNGVPRAITK